MFGRDAKHFFIELAVLTGLILAVTVSLVLVRQRGETPEERSARQ